MCLYVSCLSTKCGEIRWCRLWEGWSQWFSFWFFMLSSRMQMSKVRFRFALLHVSYRFLNLGVLSIIDLTNLSLKLEIFRLLNLVIKSIWSRFWFMCHAFHCSIVNFTIILTITWWRCMISYLLQKSDTPIS